MHQVNGSNQVLRYRHFPPHVLAALERLESKRRVVQINVAMAQRQRLGYPAAGVGQYQRKGLYRRNRIGFCDLHKPLPLDGSQLLAATLIDQCDVSVGRHSTFSVLYRTCVLQALVSDRSTMEIESGLQPHDTEWTLCFSDSVKKQGNSVQMKINLWRTIQ